MTLDAILRLVAKDWHLHRVPVILSSIGSLTALALVMLGDTTPTSLGVNLALATLITLTFYLPLMSVVEEQGRKTLLFLMSLPVSGTEYVASKVAGTLSLYMVPWLTLAIGAPVALGRTNTSINETGWVPVVLLGMVAGFCFILCVALITDSGGWTLGLTITLLFLFGNVFTTELPWAEAVSRVSQSIHDRGPAFNAALIAEAALAVMSLAAAFVVAPRKQVSA